MFDVVVLLCERFPALTPFDILERPTRDVFDLYIDAVIQAEREGKNGGGAARKDEAEQVFSYNAAWY